MLDDLPSSQRQPSLVSSELADAFVYSYSPLHSSKNWKIDYLQGRVDAQNEKLRGLEEELAAVRSEAESRPDPGEVQAMRAERAQLKRENAKMRSEAQRSEKNVQALRRSRDHWKSQHAALEAEHKAAPPPPPAAPPPLLADGEWIVSPTTSDGEAAFAEPAEDETLPAAPVEGE